MMTREGGRADAALPGQRPRRSPSGSNADACRLVGRTPSAAQAARPLLLALRCATASCQELVLCFSPSPSTSPSKTSTLPSPSPQSSVMAQRASPYQGSKLRSGYEQALATRWAARHLCCAPSSDPHRRTCDKGGDARHPQRTSAMHLWRNVPNTHITWMTRHAGLIAGRLS